MKILETLNLFRSLWRYWRKMDLYDKKKKEVFLSCISYI